jgi:integral membrane protein
MNTHRKAIYWLAVADGLALLALAFIAVPVKYFLGMPLGVSVLGPIHGTLFLSLMLATLSALYRGMLKPGLAALLFVGALIPLGAFYADYKLKQAYAKN